jgi:ribosomal protein S18 acetylase RimI-like enzyme
MTETIEIKALSPELLDDYLAFFDQVACSDHEEWSWCYCSFYHTDDDTAAELGEITREKLRDYAIRLIREGRLQGYLAYRDHSVAGWCCAGDKTSFKLLRSRPELWDDDDERPPGTLSVVCFTIAPELRGQGIASRLLDRACLDAAARGFTCIEAYPARDGGDCYRLYHGPEKMYEKAGFNLYKELPKDSVVRKIPG